MTEQPALRIFSASPVNRGIFDCTGGLRHGNTTTGPRHSTPTTDFGETRLPNSPLSDPESNPSGLQLLLTEEEDVLADALLEDLSGLFARIRDRSLLTTKRGIRIEIFATEY